MGLFWQIVGVGYAACLIIYGIFYAWRTVVIGGVHLPSYATDGPKTLLCGFVAWLYFSLAAYILWVIFT